MPETHTILHSSTLWGKGLSIQKLNIIWILLHLLTESHKRKEISSQKGPIRTHISKGQSHLVSWSTFSPPFPMPSKQLLYCIGRILKLWWDYEISPSRVFLTCLVQIVYFEARLRWLCPNHRAGRWHGIPKSLRTRYPLLIILGLKRVTLLKQVSWHERWYNLEVRAQTLEPDCVGSNLRFVAS